MQHVHIVGNGGGLELSHCIQSSVSMLDTIPQRGYVLAIGMGPNGDFDLEKLIHY